MVLRLRSRADRGSHHPKPRTACAAGAASDRVARDSVTTAMLASRTKSNGMSNPPEILRAIDGARDRSDHRRACQSQSNASSDDVPTFLQKMQQEVVGLISGTAAEPQRAEPEYTPAVTVRRSLSSRDHFISMIEGKPYKALRRHLSGHGLTPDGVWPDTCQLRRPGCRLHRMELLGDGGFQLSQRKCLRSSSQFFEGPLAR